MARLCALQQPEARPARVQRALELFLEIDYDDYRLRRHAVLDDVTGCLRQAQAILRALLRYVAVCNQAPVDTRKLAQVLALPQLPEGFAEHISRVAAATTPPAALATIDALLDATYRFLLSMQRHCLHDFAMWPVVFDAGYPELERDLQAVMQACDQ